MMTVGYDMPCPDPAADIIIYAVATCVSVGAKSC